MYNPFGLIITIISFEFMRRLKNIPIISKLSPILTSGILIIFVLKFFKIDYSTYCQSASLLTFLLIPATVCLGYPLYKNIQILTKNKRIVYFGFLISVLCALMSTYLIAKCCHSEAQIILSMLPKSTTAPIAIEISKNLGAIPELTACIVCLTGVFGAVFGHKILKFLKIKNDVAIGIAIGSASHVIGTARCIEENKPKQVASSTIGLVIAGILTVILAPLFVKVCALFSKF